MAAKTDASIRRTAVYRGPKGDRGDRGPVGPARAGGGASGGTGAAGVGSGLDFTLHGGDKTGVSDNSAALTAAATLAAADPSGKLYLPEGTYRLSQTLDFPVNLHFAEGAMLSIDSGRTVNVHGYVQADDYQQIFSGSGSVVIRDNSVISSGWFGTERDATLGASGNAIAKAIAASYTEFPTGDGYLSRKIKIPTGLYNIEKPIVLTQNVELVGEGMLATQLEVRSYAGPAILISKQAPLVQHLADYGTGSSCEVGDDTGSLTSPQCVLSNYGQPWDLDGKSGFSLDMIVKVTQPQVGSTVLLSSVGTGPDSATNDIAFAVYGMTDDTGLGILGYSNTTLGIRFELNTTGGLISAYTNTAVINTGSTWYHLRLDYDGSNMRIFVDGLAQVIYAESGHKYKAQTGNIVQVNTEAVRLGKGLSGGFRGGNVALSCPKGQRMASLRLAHASRGSSDFSPPSYKYVEDGSTKFLMNFDEVDAVGGLMFARYYSSIFGMQDAWIPNIQEAAGSQVGNIFLHDFSILNIGGPGVESTASPDCNYYNLLIRGQSGILLHQDGYFSTIKDCRLSSSGGKGVGIYLGAASNFVDLHNIYASGFITNLHSQAIFSASGGNYWINSQYATIYLEGCFSLEMSGANFVSDEGSPYHPTFGTVVKGCGVARFSGFLFGLQAYNDQYQVWVNNSTRPISLDGSSRISFDHCVFSPVSVGVNYIKATHTLAIDSIVVDDCSRGVPGTDYFTVDATNLARMSILPNEYSGEKTVVLSGTGANVDINDWCNGRLKCTGTGATGYALKVPAIAGYERAVYNTTAFTAVVTTTATGSTGVTIAGGKRARVFSDGTNVYRETADI